MLSGKTLDRVTSTGPGTPIIPDKPSTFAAMQVTNEGGATISVVLEGTVDMVNWFTVGGAVAADHFQTTLNSVLCTAFRGNLLSMTGGTDPKVTAHIAIRE